MADEAKTKLVKIAVIYAGLDCEVGGTQMLYGVLCKHEVVEVKGEELHLAVAEIEESLAKEMIDCKRARTYASVVK